MSNLVKHAEREMRLAGLYDADSDYGGMIPEAVINMIKARGEGHSGGSHYLTMQVFNKVANYETLTPITSNPDEWFMHDANYTGGKEMWQNTRQSSCFSYDAGQTWYDIDDKKKKNWPNRKWYQKLTDRFA